MSVTGNALKDLNNLPASERKNDSICKGNITKHCIGNGMGNAEENPRENTAPLASDKSNDVEIGNPKAETTTVELEYIESENLKDVEDVDTSLKSLLAGLESKDWVLVCDALNNVRRLSIFHIEEMISMLPQVIPLLVKSLKNPRSAVCKTACMTSADIFSAYKDHIIDLLDHLLTQLLLKSSQDKRFVCEAAEKALVSMTTWVSPFLLLPKLHPYLKNRNPRIRAKAAMCYSRSVPQMGVEGIREYGIEKLIQVGAPQLSDQLPESREAARTLLLELQKAYEKSHHISSEKSSEDTEIASWENFCQSKLSPLSAQAVLRVANIARESPAVCP